MIYDEDVLENFYEFKSVIEFLRVQVNDLEGLILTVSDLVVTSAHVVVETCPAICVAS